MCVTDERVVAGLWRLRPELLRYARRRLDEQTAEDVVSETLITMLRKTQADPSVDLDARRGLAYAVLVGHIRNEQRSRRRHDVAQGSWVPLLPPEACPDGGYMAVEDRAELRAVLTSLSTDDRLLLELDLAEVHISQVALRLGCSAAAAARRRSRARGRLRAAVLRARSDAPR